MSTLRPKKPQPFKLGGKEYDVIQTAVDSHGRPLWSVKQLDTYHYSLNDVKSYLERLASFQGKKVDCKEYLGNEKLQSHAKELTDMVEQWEKKNIKLIVFDFDDTITKEHTTGILSRERLEQFKNVQMFSSDFILLYCIAQLKGIKIAVASFGTSSYLGDAKCYRNVCADTFIRELLYWLLGDDSIPIITANPSKFPGMPPGKTYHLCALNQLVANGKLHPSEIILIDDDSANIREAIAQGYHGYHCLRPGFNIDAAKYYAPKESPVKLDQEHCGFQFPLDNMPACATIGALCGRENQNREAKEAKNKNKNKPNAPRVLERSEMYLPQGFDVPLELLAKRHRESQLAPAPVDAPSYPNKPSYGRRINADVFRRG